MAISKDGTYLGESSYAISTFFRELAYRSGILSTQIDTTYQPSWSGVDGIVLNGGESAMNVLGSMTDLISSIAFYTDSGIVRGVFFPQMDDLTGLWTLDPNKYIVTPIVYNQASTQPQQFKLSFFQKGFGNLGESTIYLDNSSFQPTASQVSLTADCILTGAQATKALKTAKLMYSYATGNISFTIPFSDEQLMLGQIILYKGKLYRINGKDHSHHAITYTALSDSQLFYRDKSSIIPDPAPTPPPPTQEQGLAYNFISTAPLLARNPLLTDENTDYFTAIVYSRDAEIANHTLGNVTQTTNQMGILCTVQSYELPLISSVGHPFYLPNGSITLMETQITSGRDDITDYANHPNFETGYLYTSNSVIAVENIVYNADKTIILSGLTINWGSAKTNLTPNEQVILTTGRAITVWEVASDGQLVTTVENGLKSTNQNLTPSQTAQKAGRGVTPIKILPFIYLDSTNNQHYLYFQYSKQTGDVRFIPYYPEDNELNLTINGTAADCRADRRVYFTPHDAISVSVINDNQPLTTDSITT